MKKTEFSFPSSDGKTQIHAIRWEPDEGVRVRAVLQMTHGMIEYIDRYEPLAAFMAEKGFLVVGHDHLGHGASVTDESLLGYIADHPHPEDYMVADIQALRERMQKECQGLPYFILGHSMGSYLLRKYLTRYGAGLAGALILGTGFENPLLVRYAILATKAVSLFKGSHYRSRYLQNLSYTKYYKGFGMDASRPTEHWLTQNVEILKRYCADPHCTFVFTANGYLALYNTVLFVCTRKHIAEIPADLNLLVMSGENDPVGSCGIGVKHFVDDLKTTGHNNVTCKLYKGDRHELINEPDRQTVYQDILAWTEKALETI